jgi:hypothetical protein
MKLPIIRIKPKGRKLDYLVVKLDYLEQKAVFVLDPVKEEFETVYLKDGDEIFVEDLNKEKDLF